ncbi:MAG TPA: hypothetical protein VJ917_03905, partial [Saprospiraceae bacterium]|nr:hypothetical protein [Saprospiraceae bacterium]
SNFSFCFSRVATSYAYPGLGDQGSRRRGEREKRRVGATSVILKEKSVPSVPSQKSVIQTK